MGVDKKCPVCGSIKLSGHNWNSRDNKQLLIYTCRNCHHLFQDPGHFHDIYSDSTFSLIARENAAKPGKNKIKELDERAFTRYEFYKPLLREAASALEVGSSIGSFVHILKLNGKDALGLEPDKSYAEFSEEQYFFKQEATLFENFNTKRRFDLVTSFHVIEHVNEPHDFVEKCFDLLNDNGRILLECPSWEIRNYGSRKEAIWSPHLHYFSLLSMYRLLDTFFVIDDFGYLGSALYMSGKKRKTILARPTVPFSVKYLHSYGNFIRTILPAITKKNSKADILRQLLIQLLGNSYRFSATLKKIREYGLYRLKEGRYLSAEKGSGNNKIVHITNYKGWGNNAGDIVLSKCVRDTLSFNQKKRYDISELKNAVNQSLVKRINSADSLLIGGGGLFLPDTNKNAISGWQWPVSREQLEAIKKPVILYAIGYNYFRGQEPNDLFLDNLGRILEKADFAGIRNHGSIDRINELTGNRFKDKICFQPCPTTIIRKIYPEYHHNGKERKKLAVNIAFDRYSIRFGNTIYKTLESIAKALREFEKLGYEILNVSHISADEKFGIVLDHFGIKYKTVRLQHNFPKEVFRFYAGVDLVLGMRGHAQMIPFGLGTPIISLGTHDKMKWFLEDIGSTDWYIDLNQKDGEVDKLILEKFSGIIDNKQNVLDRMKKEQDRLFAITMENLGLIEKLVNGNLN